MTTVTIGDLQIAQAIINVALDHCHENPESKAALSREEFVKRVCQYTKRLRVEPHEVERVLGDQVQHVALNHTEWNRVSTK